MPKCLSPQWLGVEVAFEKLRGCTQLKVEVRDTYYDSTYYDSTYYGATQLKVDTLYVTYLSPPPQVRDEDTLKADELIGTCTFDLLPVRYLVISPCRPASAPAPSTCCRCVT